MIRTGPDPPTSFRQRLRSSQATTSMSPGRGATAPGQAYQLDIYSFGALAFEMLAGRPPFEAPNLPALLDRHLAAPVPDLAQLRGDAPGALVGLIHACLAKDPRERPVSMEAIAHELRGCRRRSGAVTTGRHATRMPALDPAVVGGRTRRPRRAP